MRNARLGFLRRDAVCTCTRNTCTRNTFTTLAFTACVVVGFGFSTASAGVAHAQATAQSATPATPRAIAATARTYVPHRVYDSRKKQWIDFETLVQRANGVELLFVGEQHNDTPGHVMELAILEGIARRRGDGGGPVVLSLEMFERDVQGDLDAYLNGAKDEAAFLAKARPWPNYAPDYRPLVELAKTQRWPVVASNIPRPLASAVSKNGLGFLDTLNATVRAQHVAASISCPQDQYFKLFREVMSDGHGAASSGGAQGDSAKAAAAAAEASLMRVYQAQCVKDETMGEAVAGALVAARARGPGRARGAHERRVSYGLCVGNGRTCDQAR